MSYAINHCEMRDQIQNSDMDSADVSEAIMERVGEIISSRLSGQKSKPAKFPGIELMAQVIADRTMIEGARQVAEDVEIDLDRLAQQAESEHISFC